MSEAVDYNEGDNEHNLSKEALRELQGLLTIETTEEINALDKFAADNNEIYLNRCP
jgi:hypothetical protein